jgi:hypothetical protein
LRQPAAGEGGNPELPLAQQAACKLRRTAERDDNQDRAAKTRSAYLWMTNRIRSNYVTPFSDIQIKPSKFTVAGMYPANQSLLFNDLTTQPG